MTTKRHPPRWGRDGKSSDGLPHRAIECASGRVDEGIEHAVGFHQQPTNPVVAIDAPRFRTPRVHFEIAGHWNDTTSTTITQRRELTATPVMHDRTTEPRLHVVFVAPVHHRPHHRPQQLALPGQRILASAAGANRCRHDLVFDEQSETLGEDRGRNFEVFPEVGEANHAVERITDDQQRPPLADYLERARHWAHFIVVLPPQRHFPSIRQPPFIDRTTNSPQWANLSGGRVRTHALGGDSGHVEDVHRVRERDGQGDLGDRQFCKESQQSVQSVNI